MVKQSVTLRAEQPGREVKNVQRDSAVRRITAHTQTLSDSNNEIDFGSPAASPY